jgi:hypothetical protein
MTAAVAQKKTKKKQTAIFAKRLLVALLLSRSSCALQARGCKHKGFV